MSKWSNSRKTGISALFPIFPSYFDSTTSKHSVNSTRTKYDLNLIGISTSFEEQLNSLTAEQRSCYDELKRLWEERVQEKIAKGAKSKHADIELFPDPMYLTFARCSPGAKKFNADTAFKVMKNYDQRFLKYI